MCVCVYWWYGPLPSQVKRSDARLSKVREKTALAQLSALLTRLDKTLPRGSVKDTRRLLGNRERLRALHERGRAGLWEEFGFCVDVCDSRLEGGGRGVVVSEGKVPTGHLVALYPGMHLCLYVLNAQLAKSKTSISAVESDYCHYAIE